MEKTLELNICSSKNKIKNLSEISKKLGLQVINLIPCQYGDSPVSSPRKKRTHKFIVIKDIMSNPSNDFSILESKLLMNKRCRNDSISSEITVESVSAIENTIKKRKYFEG